MSTGRLTQEELGAWERDGFIVRESVFPGSELGELRDAAERCASLAEAAVGESGTGYAIDGNRYHDLQLSTVQYEHAEDTRTLRVIEPFHHFDPRLDALIDDSRLVEPMKDLVRDERVALYTDKLNLKRPREGSRFQWHQDSPYWAHFASELDRLPNVMVALDDASVANGCFRVIRASHRKGMLPGLEGQGRLGPLFTDPSGFDASEQVAMEVPAGSLVFFSPHSVHGSEPNTSDSLRRAFVITYQPGDRRMFKQDATRNAG
jgi:hypothetical protein